MNRNLLLLNVSISVMLIGAVLYIAASALHPDMVRDLLSSTGLWNAAVFSLQTSFLATLLSLLFGVPAGFFLARSRKRFIYVLELLFDLPLVIPPLIAGVLLLSLFRHPLLQPLPELIFTMSGAVIAQFFVAAPLTIKSSATAFKLVPQHYEQIARTLGASNWQAWRDTTARLALPGIGSGLILTWLRCMGEFGATLMVGGGIPGQTENIPVHIYLLMTGGDYYMGLTAAAIFILMVALCLLTLRRLELFRTQ